MARRGDGIYQRGQFFGGPAALLLAGALVAPSGTVYDGVRVLAIRRPGALP